MDAILHSLGIEWKLLLAQAINFGLLAFVLFKLAYKPLLKVLDERAAKVKEIQDNSTLLETKLKDAQATEAEMLREARQKSDELLKKAEKAGETLKADIVAEAEKRAEKLVRDAESRMKLEAEERANAFKKEAITIVADALEKTVGKYLDASAKQKLAEEASSEVGKINLK
jgi:F-type H+-transporting ATPase subunit b